MENNKDIFFDINLINDIIDGLTDEKTERDFFEHIKECSKCRRIYEEALKIRAIMKEDDFLPDAEIPSVDFTEKTMAKIRAAKKPTIIRIINHPAVKTVTAAAACLLIALFVFRSDLLGKIEGANELADDIMVQNEDTITKGKGADYDGIELPKSDSVAENGGYNIYTTEESDEAAICDSSEAVDETVPETTLYYSPAPPVNTNDSSKEYTSASGSAGGSASAYGTATEEEFVEEEAVEVEEDIADEPPPVPEIAEAEEEEIIVTTPEVAVDDSLDEIAVEDAIEEYPYEAPEATEEIDNFFTDATSRFNFFSVPDSETEETVRTVAYSTGAKDALDRGMYFKIILIPYSSDEELDWEGINATYPNRFKYVDSAAKDGYVYELFECTVTDSEDIVFDLFATTASEILPDIVSGDFSNEDTYLILVQTKK